MTGTSGVEQKDSLKAIIWKVTHLCMRILVDLSTQYYIKYEENGLIVS